jgi:hypothetical protein
MRAFLLLFIEPSILAHYLGRVGGFSGGDSSCDDDLMWNKKEVKRFNTEFTEKGSGTRRELRGAQD